MSGDPRPTAPENTSPEDFVDSGAAPGQRRHGMRGALLLTGMFGAGVPLAFRFGRRIWALPFGMTASLLACSVLLRRKLVVVTVRGSSMEPTFQHGDRVLVRRTRRPKARQIVVVEHPEHDGGWPLPPVPPSGATLEGRRWIVKRVAAAPGDPVPRALAPIRGSEDDAFVPQGSLVLLGDNPEHSVDSRQRGYFRAERTLGTVMRRL